MTARLTGTGPRLPDGRENGTGWHAQTAISVPEHALGRMYEFTAPDQACVPWTAQAKFGDQDELQAKSATEMLHVVRTHYAAKKFSGQ